MACNELNDALTRYFYWQIGRQTSGSEMTMLRQGVPSRDTGKSPVPAAPASSAIPFKEQQLKQLRAQCLVFLAFR